MIGPGQWILVEPINFFYPKQQEQQPRPLIDKWWHIDGLVQELLMHWSYVFLALTQWYEVFAVPGVLLLGWSLDGQAAQL